MVARPLANASNSRRSADDSGADCCVCVSKTTSLVPARSRANPGLGLIAALTQETPVLRAFRSSSYSTLERDEDRTALVACPEEHAAGVRDDRLAKIFAAGDAPLTGQFQECGP